MCCLARRDTTPNSKSFDTLYRGIKVPNENTVTIHKSPFLCIGHNLITNFVHQKFYNFVLLSFVDDHHEINSDDTHAASITNLYRFCTPDQYLHFHQYKHIMPPKMRIPKKPSKLVQAASTSNPIARPAQREPALTADRDVEHPSGDRNVHGSIPVASITNVGGDDNGDDDDDDDADDDESSTIASRSSRSPTINSRDHSEIRSLEALLRAERLKSAKLKAQMFSSHRTLARNGLDIPDPLPLRDYISEEDDIINDVDTIEVGTFGFRDGPYIYVKNPIDQATVPALVERKRQEYKDKNNGAEPWDRYTQTPDAEAAWRRITTNTVSQVGSYESRNWIKCLYYCNIPDGVARYAIIRVCNLYDFKSLTSADDDTFKGYITTFQKSATGSKTSIPLPAIPCLKALRCWARWHRLTTGSSPVATDFTYEEAVLAWKRYNFESNLSINKMDTPTPPDKFKSFKLNVWRVFSDAVITYFSSIRGVLHLPLSYLLRPVDTYSTEALARYAEMDDNNLDSKLLRTIILDLNTPEIAEDNGRLYTLLIPLIQNTTAWEHCRGPSFIGNGRAVWKALLHKGDGDANQMARMWEAQTILRTAKLDESNRGDPKAKFDAFIRNLTMAFNELEACNAPVDPSQQVLTLLRQLGSPSRFDPCRPTIIESPNLNSSFTNCVSFLDTVAGTTAHTTTVTASTRNVAAVTTEAPGRLPKAQWDALTVEQRKAHVKKMRSHKSAAPNGSANKRKPADNLSRGQKKEFKRLRSVQALAQTLVQSYTANGTPAPTVSPPQPSNPSAQFGSQIQALNTLITKGKNSD